MAETEPTFYVLTDLDNVLGHTAEEIINWSNTWVDLGKLGVDGLTLKHYREDFHTMWGVSREEGGRRWEEFCENHMAAISPDPVMQRVMNAFAKHFSIAVLTSRSRSRAELTAQWVQRHYPQIGQVMHALTDWSVDPEAHLKTKAWSLKEYLRTGLVPVLPDVAIDDEPKHTLAYRDFGVKHALLFGKHAWNTAARKEEGIVWLPNAQLLEEYILEAHDEKMKKAA